MSVAEFKALFDGSEADSPEAVARPENKVLEWKGKRNVFQYWHRFDEPDADGNKGEKRDIAPPLYFLMVAVRNSISGWDHAQQKAVYSNYVKSVQHEQLHVRAGDFRASGMYDSLKPTFKQRESEHPSDTRYKFTVNVWGVLFTKEGHDIVRIDLKGDAITNWFEGGFANDGCPIKITVGEERKKSGNIYRIPAFESTNKQLEKDDAIKAAIQAHKVINEYLAGLDAPKVETKPVQSASKLDVSSNAPEPSQPEVGSDNDLDELPF